MAKKIILVAALLSASLASAAELRNSPIISDSEPVITLAMADNTWSVVATSRVKGMTKVREFHDMGDAGVQQLDYVVNCGDRKLSLANFKVLTAMSAEAKQMADLSYGQLSFYKPVIQHDINIVDNVCGGRLAMGDAPSMN